ncbi:unnamed protein product [Rotaria magnacalcarata]|uniref:Uncharacterized protein n=1 Tax=Rotaria magnacalcarata TaxID=392030 RepID=A0A820EHE2_9BILA|nr:unnamed protein product [Rotaria magnacalcarata]
MASIQLIIVLITLKISESVDLCPGHNAVNFTTIFLITFENGSDTLSNKTPADYNFTTSHVQTWASIINDGTGDVPACYNMSWSKYGISFKATHSSVVLLMISNVAEGNGNDVVVDDIELRVYLTNDLDDTFTTG